MQFKTFPTSQMASDYVAQMIIRAIKNKPTIKLGLATGSTPIELYQFLVIDYQTKQTNWKQVTTFNLDEYLNLPIDHEQTYRVFMNEQLFNHLNIPLEQTHFPQLEQNYDQLIESHGGIDIQILGIGTNGHIGFNEPGSAFNSLTRVVDLTSETISVNAKKFFAGNEDLVPKQAISMGIGSILKAQKIILLAFGSTKKEAMRTLKQVQDFDPDFPASALIKHPDVTIIMDQEAADDL